MAHEVFISYSTKDKPVADAVCARLEQDSCRCWYAPRDIAPGADWAGSIIEAVEQSRVMVVIFTDFANESRQVLREINNAVRCGVVIVPFRLTKTSPSGSMRYYLSTVHWLDALDGELEENIARLSELVRTVLNGKPPEKPAFSRTPIPEEAPDVEKPEFARLIPYSALIHLILKLFGIPVFAIALATDTNLVGTVALLMMAAGAVINLIPALPLKGRAAMIPRIVLSVLGAVCCAVFIWLIYSTDPESHAALATAGVCIALWSVGMFLSSKQDLSWTGRSGRLPFQINYVSSLVLMVACLLIGLILQLV